MIDIRSLPPGPLVLTASEAECAALATRFAIIAVHALEARVVLVQDTAGREAGEEMNAVITADGRLSASIMQACAVSGEDLALQIDEPLVLQFVPEHEITHEELELDAADLDEITYSGSAFDLGEAIAQSLALAIDPYVTGPEAERARRESLSTPEASGPFAALAALKKQ